MASSVSSSVIGGSGGDGNSAGNGGNGGPGTDPGIQGLYGKGGPAGNGGDSYGEDVGDATGGSVYVEDGNSISNADAIADMAVANFVEMRDRVINPRFLLKKQIGFELGHVARPAVLRRAW